MTAAAAEERERVGPYQVIQPIGAGGSARIDLARIDRAYGFQRHVVIKRPLEHLRGNPKVAASLRREARIGGQLRHPNLVAILDAGIHDGYDYLVLEYIHGAALRTVMQAEAPGGVRELPLAVALAIVTDVARGMHEAHELTDDHGAPLGLVHRDVSPGNILLGLDGTVKLADFGIAKETRVSTLSGSMHGTVTYMAPEQCQGHAFDRRADVFSLGVILYELVTGTRLFWADNDVASLHRVLSGNVPRPRQVKPAVAGALEDIMMTAVAHDADQRYPTALELAHALERYAADAGEVLGARWIARTMEDVLGPQQVPWIAAATVPDAAPRGDGSLVDLIAAAEPDEAIPPSFGDIGDEIGVADTVSIAAVAIEEPSAPPSREPDLQPQPVRSARRTQRRGRTLAAGIIALGVIGGSAVTALVMTRSSHPAAMSAAPPATSLAHPAIRSAQPATSLVPPAAPPTTSPPPPVTNPTPPPAHHAKKKPRPQPAIPANPTSSASHDAPPTVAEPKASDLAATQRNAGTPPVKGPGSGSPEPAVKPPPNVEWKPTLLLPTDGSAARPPR